MAQKKSVVAAENNDGRRKAESFSHLFVNIFPIYLKRAHTKGNLFLQDGDLSQNSVIVGSAWDEIDARKSTIPARISDVNPIENIFHIFKQTFHQDVGD